MPFLLDTNVVSALVNNRPASVVSRFDQILKRGHEIYLSSIVVHELRYGASNSARPVQNHAQLDSFISGPFVAVSFDDDDAREAGDIRANLRKAGTPIGPYDVLIAGQARRRGLTLVTANVRAFKRVRGLKVENWL